MLEAEDSNTPRSEAGLAYPYILRAVYLSILRIATFQLLVQSVGLVHYIEVGDLPPTEVEQLCDSLLAHWEILLGFDHVLIDR